MPELVLPVATKGIAWEHAAVPACLPTSLARLEAGFEGMLPLSFSWSQNTYRKGQLFPKEFIARAWRPALERRSVVAIMPPTSAMGADRQVAGHPQAWGAVLRSRGHLWKPSACAWSLNVNPTILDCSLRSLKSTAISGGIA